MQVNTSSDLYGRLILDLAGTSLTSAEAATLSRPGVSGVILFARNIHTAKQVAELTASVRSVRPDLLIAVDQEGGRVQRLKEGFTLLPPMRSLGFLYDFDAKAAVRAAHFLGHLMAAEVLQVGIDLSFAPVLDLDYGFSQVIGDRAFAAQPAILIELATAFIKGMHLAGMAATGKHFPGHGFVEADSHLALPVDTRSLAELKASCLLPFQALAQQLQGIMPAHIVYEQIDSQPAGFSKFWLAKLRKELNFRGVIFSDDLCMEGASQAGSFSQRAAAAFAAGCDQVLVCNNSAAALEVLDWIEDSNLEGCARLGALIAQSPSSLNWLASPEAILAQQLAKHLNAQDYVAALNLLN